MMKDKVFGGSILSEKPVLQKTSELLEDKIVLLWRLLSLTGLRGTYLISIGKLIKNSFLIFATYF